MWARMVHHAPAVEADQFSLLDVPCYKQPLPLVSTGVHVLYDCTSDLLYKKIQGQVSELRNILHKPMPLNLLEHVCLICLMIK